MSSEDGSKLVRYSGYYDNVLLWDFLDATYTGGPQYKSANDASGASVFIPHEFESQKRVNRRFRHSTYKNYARPIVDKFTDFVYRSDIEWPKTEGKTNLEEFMNDVDGQGTSFQAYMRQATNSAQIAGEVLVGLDAPMISEEDKDLTAQQARDKGLRPVLTLTDIRLMLDFEMEGKEFKRIVIARSRRVKESLFSEEQIIETAIEWNKDGWIEYDKDGGVLQTQEHGFGYVPFWIYKYNKDGTSQIIDIAECSRKVFNLSSLHDEELYSRTFTQVIITGQVAAADASTVLGGNSNVVVFPGENVKVETIGALAEQAESILNAIMKEIKEIWRQAGIESGDPTETSQPESGTARAWAFHSTEQMLAGIADGAEDIANLLLGKLRELGAIDDFDPVKYPDKFDVTAFADELKSALELLTLESFPPTAEKAVIMKLIRKFFPDIDPVLLKKIEDEIDEALEEKSVQLDFSNAINLTESNEQKEERNG